MTFATVTTPAFLATGFYNVDSSRFRAAPLDTRTETVSSLGALIVKVAPFTKSLISLVSLSIDSPLKTN